VPGATFLTSDLCSLTWKGCVDGGPGRLSQKRPGTEARQTVRSVLCPLSSALERR
jgi:hypothetical protein